MAVGYFSSYFVLVCEEDGVLLDISLGAREVVPLPPVERPA